jgi:hypothetical protein
VRTISCSFQRLARGTLQPSKALDSENRERILAARLLMVVSASIAFTLGAVHLVYTFWRSMLTPRDPALRISMSQISPASAILH